MSRHNKRRKQYKRNNLTIKAIRSIIKTDVLNGNTNSEVLAKNHGLKISEVNNAINYLMENDYNVKEYYASLESERKPDSNNQQHKKQKANIPENIKEDICAFYEAGQHTMKELAVKYKISLAQISKIIKAGIPEERFKEIKSKNMSRNHSNNLPSVTESTEVVVVEDVYPEEETEIINVSFDEDIQNDIIEIDPRSVYITVGLIDNRHNLGVDKFIFDSIEDSDIFNFPKLEKIVKDFIYNNIEFVNNIPRQGLIVRCTGLQSAIMTLTKVCYDLKINLIISHHQITSTAKFMYRQQPIFTDFPIYNNMPYVLSYVSDNSDNIYLYKSQIEDYIEADKFYELQVINKPESCRGDKNSHEVKALKQFSILASTIEDALLANINLAHQFAVDRTYYRSIIIKEYSSDNSTAIGYSTQILQRAYY